MFQRQQHADGDLVAAARRRLAALSVQHTPDAASNGAGRQREAALDEGGDEVDSGASSAADRTTGMAEETAPMVRPARHLASRTAQLGRWGVRSQHVTVVALGVALLVMLVAWWALRSVPHAQQVDVSSNRELPGVPVADVASADSMAGPVGGGGGAGAGAGVGSPAPSTAATSRLVVDVAGKVRRPGIVELPSGSRVVDAIAAAGGARPGVSLTPLNLARLLVDGEQIVVGLQVPGGGGGPPAAGGGTGPVATPTIAPVGLNTATADQLDALPGIGPVTAQAILQWRTDNGPFTSVDELLEVSGIGDVTLDDIRPYVYV